MEEASEAYGRKVLRNDFNFFTLIYLFFQFSISFRFEDFIRLRAKIGFKVLSSAVLCLVFLLYFQPQRTILWKHGDEQVHGYCTHAYLDLWSSAKLTGRARASNTTS